MYPFENPLGFGASDSIEFAIAALLVLMVLLRSRVVPGFRRLASHPVLSMLALAGLAAVMRLILLPHHPVPTPDI